MKLLSKRILGISKLVLLFSLLSGGAWAQSLITSERFLLKIIDRTVSLFDFQYQQRNLRALHCIYDDSLVVQYFGRPFVKEFEVFLKDFPQKDDEVRRYLIQHEELLKKIRHYFKILRYSEDQKTQVSPKLTKVVREATRENRCDKEVLHKDTLKTNFISLLQMELYFRSRYAGQLKSSRGFEAIRPSIDLFVESLDKQFQHEYFW
jgi:hypothetical protein